MKKILCSILMLSASLTYGQIQIGSNEIPTMNRPGKISSSSMNDFKKSTTIFTLQFKDYAKLQDYEKAIGKVWKITPFKIVKPDEMPQYMKEGYSIFSFGGYLVQRQGSSTTTSNMHLAYDLWLPDMKKNGNVKQDFLARISIFANPDAFSTAMKGLGFTNKKFSSKMTSFLYKEAELYNWNPGFLMGYLKTVNDRLTENNERGPFSEETDKTAMSKLKNDTLYIPDYVYIRYKMFSGSESVKDDQDETDIKKIYPYPFRILPAAELNQLILEEGKSIKYLTYVKSSTDKFLNIFDSKTGKLIFARYVKLSYNFKNKDLARVEKAID